MGARTARIGFTSYAATLLALVGVGFWNSVLMGRLGHDAGRGLDWQFKILGGVYLGLEVLGIVALVLMTRVPVATRARRLLIAAASVAGGALVVGLVERVLVDTHLVSYERMETMLRIVNVVAAAAYTASESLLAVAAMRIARAARQERVRIGAIVALVVRAAVFVVQLVPARLDGLVWAHRASDLLFAGLCAALAVIVVRVDEPAAARVPDGGDGRLAAAWRAPADGISIYLGAAAARVACAIMSWLVMLGAQSAKGVGDLRDVRAQLLVVATLSAMATIVMLLGLWRITAAPVESRASGPAVVALALAVLGFGLDLWGTWVTAEALDGSVSAAFFAMDSLPIIGGIAALLGIGAAIALLTALGHLATALGLADVAGRARGAIGWVLGTGALFGVAAALSRMAELMLVVALLALPLAIAALVQFLRVAFAVGRDIRARL
ncbi:MAG TPA: hypothetical protein VN947_20545 [Polyangia bacterium]|nr:hypothetical protein [Polyangia bacterium]